MRTVVPTIITLLVMTTATPVRSANAAPPPAAELSCLGDAPQNVIVFLLDDMRFDGMWAMPLTSARLAANGVDLSRAYVTTPMCCPDRASMLSGGFLPVHVGVLSNELPNGGALRFIDTVSLPLRLQQAGYSTGLVGKYLNQYEHLRPHVPPGWTSFAASYEPQPWTGFYFIEGSTGDVSTEGERTFHAGYVTDVQSQWARAFVDAHAAEPFLLYVSFLAPHFPHAPAPEDRTSFLDYLYRERGYDEEDVSDKPAWIQALPRWDAAPADADNIERLQSLASVDRAVYATLAEVDALGIADHTLVIFTSDNGEQWGEHRLSQKGLPYEESVRVPLIVSHPSLTAGTRDVLVAANLDIGATIQDVAGIELRTDGQSLVPMLCDPSAGTRDGILLQGWPTGFPGWASVVTGSHKYTEWTTGESELYDLDVDPFELTSVDADPALGEVRAELSEQLHDGRGLTIAADALPNARAGVAYAAMIPLWGGTPPFDFTLAGGELPPGLELTTGGMVLGTPILPGIWEIGVNVEDSSISPYHGGPLSLNHPLRIEVVPAAPEPCGCGTQLGPAAAWMGVALLVWGARRPPRPPCR